MNRLLKVSIIFTLILLITSCSLFESSSQRDGEIIVSKLPERKGTFSEENIEKVKEEYSINLFLENVPIKKLKNDLSDFSEDQPPGDEPVPEFYGEPISTDSKIKVASWNVLNLSKNKPATSINQMVKVINKYDLIGLQEVLHTEPIRKIKSGLSKAGSKFYTITTKRKGRTKHLAERYSFIYNSKTIEALNKGRYGKVKGMARTPYYALFKAKGGNFDFIYMLLHTQPPTGKRMKRELSVLAKNVNKVRIDNKEEPDIIVAGDFNADPKYVHMRSFAKSTKLSNYIIPSKTSTMVAGKKTNDNMYWGAPTVKDFTGSKGIDHFNKGLSKKVALKVSDHKPIWAEFFTNKDEEDGI